MASGHKKIQGKINSASSGGCCEITGKLASGGVTDHTRLVNRDLPDQHPIDAITDLRTELSTLNRNKLDASTALPLIDEALQSKAKGMYYDAKKELARKSYWYLCAEIDPVTKQGTKDSIISGPYDLGMGGGGGGNAGGGVTDVKVTQQDWPGTVVVGADTKISVYWSSTIGDEKTPTGAGTVYVLVNERQVASRTNQPQGRVTFDLTEYLSSGLNTVQVKVLDMYGTTGLTVGTIEAVDFQLTSDFNSEIPYAGDVTYTYTPYGNASKQVYFILNGIEVGKQLVRSSGDLQTFTIKRDKFFHGAHSLEVYFTSEVNGVLVRTDPLKYSLIWYNYADSTPIIASTSPEEFEANQYFSFSIPYRVYIANKNRFSVRLYINGSEVNSLSVDTSTQYFEHRSNTATPKDQPIKMTIECSGADGKTARKTFSVHVLENELDITPILTNQALALSAVGRSNAEAIDTRAIWKADVYDNEGTVIDNINCELEDFNWSSNGWLRDTSGNSILRVSGDARVKIPYKPFKTNCRTTGKTIEFEFATSVVKNYSSPIISCLDGQQSSFYETTPSYANIESEDRLKIFILEVDNTKLAERLSTQGTYVFSYTARGWELNGEVVDLAEYGITIVPRLNDQNGEGTAADLANPEIPAVFLGDNITVEHTVNARGFIITPQAVTYRSAAAVISSQYKEEEHVRVSFVIEPEGSVRKNTGIVWIYLNGIASGAIHYSGMDSFQQMEAADIIIGSADATVDIYNIRIYDIALNSKQVVNNWIADTQDAPTRIARYNHNDNYNDRNELTIAKLKESCPDLPYIIWDIDPLPQYKGDKRLGNAEYYDPAGTQRSFKSIRAQYNVQGTSSAVYPEKNIRIKFKAKDDDPKFEWFNGDGDTVKKFPITYPNGIGENYFTFKVDYASSEGANNVELVRLYNDIVKERRWLTPPQRQDDRVRVGIDGFPIVAFHQSKDGVVQFRTKANFNNDKANEDTYGFAEGDESWEITNNTFDGAKFKLPATVDNYSESFEIRFPDQEGYGKGEGELTKLAAMTAWLASTNREAATGEKLEQTYHAHYTNTTVLGGKETSTTEIIDRDFDYDTPEYRLAKFKTELPDWFDVNSSLLYYIFTATFLMIDSRAKNAFPTYYASREPGDGGDRWFWLPYDMDTALGIDNKGKLVFDYSLEDDERQANGLISGTFVYNGQDSTMWRNIRDAYAGELAILYADLRISQTPGKPALFSYENVEAIFEQHQGKWSENIFNEDAYNKYVKPLIAGTNYLEMLQGSKAEQRKWWLFNRFRFMDSKYLAGDAKQNYMQFRAYLNAQQAKPDITITPYADIYATVSWANGVITSRFAKRGQQTIVPNPTTLDATMTDQEVYIYSVDQIKSFGDLSPFLPDTVNISNAIRLQDIKLGDSSINYVNPKLTSFELSANTLLRKIDVSNCVELGSKDANLSAAGCSNIEEIYASGTQLQTIELPTGGNMKILQAPPTLSIMKIINHPLIEEIRLDGISNLTEIWLENTPLNKFKLGTLKPGGEAIKGGDGIVTKVAEYDYSPTTLWNILGELKPGSRLRLMGIDETAANEAELVAMYDHFDNMVGLDAQGEATQKAEIQGQIHIEDISYKNYTELSAKYPEIEIIPTNIICNVQFTSEGVVLRKEDGQPEIENVITGSTVSGPAKNPTKDVTQSHTYEFSHWEYTDKDMSRKTWTPATVIMYDIVVEACYTETIRQYTVTYNTDSEAITAITPDGGNTHTKNYGEKLDEPMLLDVPDEVSLVGWFTDSGMMWEFNTHTLTQDIVLTAKWSDPLKPTLSIIRQAYNKVKLFAYDNVGVSKWAVVKDSLLPPEAWNELPVTETEFETDYVIDGFGTYYFWISDRNATCAEPVSITAYEVVPNLGEGVDKLVLTESLPEGDFVQVEATNGHSAFALSGTRFNIAAVLDSHYEKLHLFVDDAEIKADGTDSYLIDNAAITISATASRKVYTVNFVTNTNIDSGAIAVESQKITYLYKASEPKTIYYKGHITEHWYTDASLADEFKWDFENDLVVGDTTLYVKWIPYTTPTRIKIRVPAIYDESIEKDDRLQSQEDFEANNMTVTVHFTQTSASKIRVRFEDGLDTEDVPTIGASAISHTYAEPGEYIIEFYGSHECDFTLGAGTINRAVVTPSCTITDVDFAWDIVMPHNYSFYGAQIENLKLTAYMNAVGDYAFMKCSKLKNFEFPDTITEVGAGAFKNCISLTEVNITPKIAAIGSAAFQNCTNLIAIYFPPNDGALREISSQFASISGLRAILIPSYINVIRKYAFSSSTLEKIVILNPDTEIEDLAFNSLVSIESAGPINWATAPENWSAWYKDYISYVKKLNSGDLTATITCCTPYDFEYAWGTVEGHTEIPAFAFSCGTGFEQSFIKSLVLPEGITAFGEAAFRGCARIKTFGINNTSGVTIPNTLATIGKECFYYTSMAELDIPSSVSSIGDRAFGKMFNLTRATIRTNLSLDRADSAEEGWFYECPSTTELYIPRSFFSGNEANLSAIQTAYGTHWCTYLKNEENDCYSLFYTSIPEES